MPTDWEKFWLDILTVKPPAVRGLPPEAPLRRMTGRPYPTLNLIEKAAEVVFGYNPAETETVRRERTLVEAQKTLARLVSRWTDHDPTLLFRAERKLLEEELYSVCASGLLPSLRWATDIYLQNFSIKEAVIPGVGTALRMALLNHGVRTAADVDACALGNVPGFGRERIAAMVAWRRSHERSVHLLPYHPMPPLGDLIPEAFGPDRMAMRQYQRLRDGAEMLRRIAKAEEEKTARERVEILAARRALAQAQADLVVPWP